MNAEIVPRIQTVMDHYGLTVSAFADQIGVQRSSISHLLNGRNKPSLDFVMKLVDTYPQVNLYWLLQGVGEFPSSVDSKEAQVEIPVPKGMKSESVEINPGNLSEGKDSPEAIKVIVLYSDGTFESFHSKKH